MIPTDRRKRRFEAREHLILDNAETIFGRSGYLGLNLDELAEAVAYSKATLYNHFASKEDLLAAIAVRRLEERARMFRRALAFAGRHRERMCCVGLADELLRRKTPHIFALMQMVRSPSLWEKAKPETRERYETHGTACFRVLAEIVREAKADGELPADESRLPTMQVVSGLAAISLGSFLLDQKDSLFRVGAGGESPSPVDLLPAQYDAYLDGLDWPPLGSEWDYAATRERARAFLAETAPE